MAGKATLESKIRYRVKRSAGSVFMRQDFEDLGGYDQVGRVLRQLVKKEVLMHIGYGLYARATKSIINGTTIPEKPLPWLGQEALTRLGVEIRPTRAVLDYNSGKSTQVPTGRRIGVRGAFRAKSAITECVYTMSGMLDHKRILDISALISRV